MGLLRERKWPSVIIPTISVANAIITVASTSGLHPKQIATLTLTGITKDFEIKRVLSATQLQVGPLDAGIGVTSNPIAFDGGMLTVVEQNRNAIDMDAHWRAVYAEEPTVAVRTIGVDEFGAYIGPSNPLPVTVISGAPTQSLGALGMPDYIKELLDTLEYDSVTSATVGNVETITFALHGTDLFNITITQTANGWQISSAGLFSYILQENGEHILTETGVGALIQEG